MVLDQDQIKLEANPASIKELQSDYEPIPTILVEPKKNTLAPGEINSKICLPYVRGKKDQNNFIAYSM